MNKTFDADENYDLLTNYCETNGIKIGHVINKGIKNFLVEHKVLKE